MTQQKYVSEHEEDQASTIIALNRSNNQQLTRRRQFLKILSSHNGTGNRKWSQSKNHRRHTQTTYTAQARAHTHK